MNDLRKEMAQAWGCCLTCHKHIYFDVDGVLRDLKTFFLEKCPGKSMNSYNAPDFMEYWEKVSTDRTLLEELYTEAPVCIGAKEAFESIRSVHRGPITFLTCSLSEDSAMENFTVDWLSKHGFLSGRENIVFVKTSKEEYLASRKEVPSIVIDDRIHTLRNLVCPSITRVWVCGAYPEDRAEQEMSGEVGLFMFQDLKHVSEWYSLRVSRRGPGSEVVHGER